MGAVSYAYECKYSGCRLPCKMVCFSSCRFLFEHLNVAVNGWGWETMSFFWMGSRAYVIFSNGVARGKRLGNTGLDSDLQIRIQRKLSRDTTTSFFVSQSQLLNKVVCNSPLEVEPTVLILESRLKVKTSFSGHPCGFRLPSALYTSLKWNMRLSDTNLQIAPVVSIVWVATQTISRRARK